MKCIETKLEGVFIIEPKVYEDNRGFYMETWSESKFKELGLNYNFVQDNHLYSAKKGTIRGIHFQKGEDSQAKLARCTKGAVIDFVVDLRPESKTFLQWIGVELSAENKRMIMLPRRMGHGVVNITDESEFSYKVDNPYNPASEGGIIWNDSNLNVDWGIANPILSDKDKILPKLDEIDFTKLW